MSDKRNAIMRNCGRDQFEAWVKGQLRLHANVNETYVLFVYSISDDRRMCGDYLVEGITGMILQ